MRRNLTRPWWTTGALALLALSLPALASAQPQVQASSYVPAGAHGLARVELVDAVAGQHVTLRYTVENPGDAELLVLKWETPFDGFFGEIFDVRVDGKPVPYIGPLYKLGTPVAESYVRVAPHDSASVDFDLGAAYLLDRGGEYSVGWHGLMGLDDAQRLKATAPVPELLRFSFAGHGEQEAERYLQMIDQATTIGGVHNEYSTDGCSSSEQTGATAGYNQAKSYATESVSFLSNLASSQRPGDKRYEHWFGDYTSSRYSTVQSHFSKIKSALTSNAKASMVFVCDCNQAGVFAFVYPNIPYFIHLCPEYWNAPTKGHDSKGGTLIHEISHFSIVAGTHDYAYGTNAAQNLANSNPNQAVANADNHEYFSENTLGECKGNNCGGGGGGGGGGGTAKVKWTIIDKCQDGKGIQFKFFTEPSGPTYPSATTHYVINSNQQGAAIFNAPKGAKLCLGADTNPKGNIYWCEGVLGTKPVVPAQANLCCKTVGSSGLTYTLQLFCD